jgi:predicted tellurium resistance membrane protein TerC
VNLAFSVDSILVAVAMSPKRWVVISGGILGIVAMRVVVGQLIVLVERYPAIVDGAFIIIAWVGLKLGVDYLHEAGYIAFGISQWVSIGLVVAIFLVAFIYARIQGPVERVSPLTEKAEEMLDGREG